MGVLHKATSTSKIQSSSSPDLDSCLESQVGISISLADAAPRPRSESSATADTCPLSAFGIPVAFDRCRLSVRGSSSGTAVESSNVYSRRSRTVPEHFSIATQSKLPVDAGRVLVLEPAPMREPVKRYVPIFWVFFRGIQSHIPSFIRFGELRVAQIVCVCARTHAQKQSKAKHTHTWRESLSFSLEHSAAARLPSQSAKATCIAKKKKEEKNSSEANLWEGATRGSGPERHEARACRASVGQKRTRRERERERLRGIIASSSALPGEDSEDSDSEIGKGLLAAVNGPFFLSFSPPRERSGLPRVEETPARESSVGNA